MLTASVDDNREHTALCRLQTQPICHTQTRKRYDNANAQNTKIPRKGSLVVLLTEDDSRQRERVSHSLWVSFFLVCSCRTHKITLRPESNGRLLSCEPSCWQTSWLGSVVGFCVANFLPTIEWPDMRNIVLNPKAFLMTNAFSISCIPNAPSKHGNLIRTQMLLPTHLTTNKSRHDKGVRATQLYP